MSKRQARYDYEIVDRPDIVHQKTHPVTLDLIATAETGRALHFQTLKTHMSSRSPAFRRKGFRLRTQRDDSGGYYAWCERIEDEKPS